MGKTLSASHFRHAHHGLIIFNLERCFPMQLKFALQAALMYGNFEILENTLLAVTSLHSRAKAFIIDSFWKWLVEFDHFEITMGPLLNVRRIFGLLKPHLIFTNKSMSSSFKRISTLPLIQEMVKSPQLYWSEEMLKSGVEWAQSLYEAAMAERNSENGLTSLAPKDYDYLVDVILQYPHNELLLDNMELLKEHYRLEELNVKSTLGLIAVSSNYKLLDRYLDFYHPKALIGFCPLHPQLRRRILFMLHLSHKTTSFKFNGERVNKNSLFFRDWVMCRITDHPADLKLLYSYLVNRTQD